jgi:lipoate---protein ligase
MRHLEYSYPTIAANLALDEALLVEVEEGIEPVMRVWESPELAVVLGASGRRCEEVYVEACRADRVAVARRSSGGGTVLIGPGALNVAIVLPIEMAPGLAAVDVAQQFVLERVAQALRVLDPAIEMRGSGDLVLGLRKFAGSAQRRLRRHFLVHISILNRFPIDLIARYLRVPRRQPEYRQGRSHEEFLTNLKVDRDRLIETVRDVWIPPGQSSAPVILPEVRVRELIGTKFADPNWIERF